MPRPTVREFSDRYLPFILTFLLTIGLIPANIQPAGAAGTPTFSGFTTPITANEQTPTTVFPGITFSDSGTDYAGGWIEFTFDTSTAADKLTLETVTTASVVADAISVVGTTIFKGNGTTATAIGTIDPTYNGTSGKKLKVNFSNTFTNGGFTDSRTTVVGDVVSLSGWTAYKQNVRLAGVSTIAGWPTPTDNAFPAQTDGTANKDSSVPSNTYTVNTAYAGRSGGGYSVQLATNGSCANGYCIIRGPYIVSNDPVYLQAGDSVSFWWSALGASDAYDVYGYLLNVDNGDTIQLLNATGANGAATQPWKAETTTVTAGQEGNYKFVFIAGTWDASGGRAEGASLLIDDVSVSVSASTSITDADVANLAALLRYEETSDAPSASRTIRIATNTSATGGVQTITINPVNDAIVIQSPSKITRLRDMSDSSTATGTLSAYDPDLGIGVNINPTYGITGGTLNLSTNKIELIAQYGKLSVDTATGAYSYEFFVDTVTALASDASESIVVTATAGSETATANLVIRLYSPSRTISFTTPATLAVTKANGDLFPIVATPSAGDDDGTITYSAGASTGCAIVGTNVKITAASGTCSITATISAGTYWSSATTSSPLVVTIGSGGGGGTSGGGSSPTQYPQPKYVVDPTFGGTQGQPYSLKLQTENTVTYELQGSLPPGLSLNSTTGVISGTPTVAGTYRFIIILRGIQVGIGSTFDFVIQPAPKAVVVPIPDPQAISDAQFGNPWVTLNGTSMQATIRPNSNKNGMEVIADGWSLNISGVQEDGKAAQLLGQQVLLILEGQKAYVGGSGFKPNSEARVYIFSTPILLGKVMTDSKGEFSGLFDVPTTIAEGMHMIQVNGISPQNDLRSASLPALYGKPKAAPVQPTETPKPQASSTPTPTPTPSSTASTGNLTLVIPFAFNDYKVSNSQVALIKKLAAKKAAQVKVVGYAQPSSKQPDIAISLNRAIEVKKSISSLLPKATYTVRGSGPKTNPLCAPYKNKCVVVYVNL